MPNEHRVGYHVRDMTLSRVLTDKAARLADKVFLTCLPGGRQYTYGQLDELAHRAANGFARLGIGKGDHVAMLMDNSPELLIAYLGLARLGAVWVPINTSARGQHLRYFLEQSDSIAVIADRGLLGRVLDIQQELQRPLQLIVHDSVAGEDAPASAAAPAQAAVTSLVDVFDSPATPRPESVRFCDLATILYTSGTTGPSKGVMYTQARVITGAAGHIETRGFNSGDVFYVTLPMFHSNALLGAIFVALLAEASVVLALRFSVSRFWSQVREHDVTVTNLLGSMANFLWNQPPAATDREHRIRLMMVAPVPRFAQEFEARFGVSLLGGYGLSDYGVPAVVPLDAPPEKRASAGLPRPGWSIRIVDDDDFDVPTGETGEILLRTDNAWEASSGYYKMPEATVASWRNFWFHTGDRGRLDADGYLWFVDRKKDAIRRRGENISAYEIERIVLTHASVREVAAYPLKSELSEDEVVIAVAVRDGTEVTEAQLIEHCATNMAHFMVPRFIHFVSDFPRTLTQKIEKYRLKADAEAGKIVLWDREAHGIAVKR